MSLILLEQGRFPAAARPVDVQHVKRKSRGRKRIDEQCTLRRTPNKPDVPRFRKPVSKGHGQIFRKMYKLAITQNLRSAK